MNRDPHEWHLRFPICKGALAVLVVAAVIFITGLLGKYARAHHWFREPITNPPVNYN